MVVTSFWNTETTLGTPQPSLSILRGGGTST